MPADRTRLRATIGGALLLLVLAGCAADRSVQVSSRLLVDEPTELLDAARLAGPHAVLEVDFRQPDSLRDWTLISLTAGPAGPAGVELRATSADPRLIATNLTVDAAAVAVVEVELEGLETGSCSCSGPSSGSRSPASGASPCRRPRSGVAWRRSRSGPTPGGAGRSAGCVWTRARPPARRCG